MPRCCGCRRRLLLRDRQTTAQGHFILRVSQFLKQATLEIWQGECRLAQQRYGQLIPNLPVHLNDRWLSQVDNAGENVRLRIV
jgi:hypothetical protein